MDKHFLVYRTGRFKVATLAAVSAQIIRYRALYDRLVNRNFHYFIIIYTFERDVKLDASIN